VIQSDFQDIFTFSVLLQKRCVAIFGNMQTETWNRDRLLCQLTDFLYYLW